MTEHLGRVLGGRYRLLAPLGSGVSAEVYLADDVRLRRQVAVKVLRAALADDPSFLRRFRAEAQAAAALNHPHIVAVFDWSDEDDAPYLVTEYLSGGSLRSMLDAGHRLTPSQALVVGLEAARALDHAHRQGFVHRDVKPANLLFGDDSRLRIADFGLARAIAEAAWTEPHGAVLGTARYASPEQALGQTVDGRSDVYALALVIVEAVTGQVPFSADTPARPRPHPHMASAPPTPSPRDATLMARVGRPLDVPEALGPLRPVLEYAAHIDPAGRLDADRFGRALIAAAEQLPRPTALPLAGASLAGSAPSPTAVSPQAGVSPTGSPAGRDATAVIPAGVAREPGSAVPPPPPRPPDARDDTSPMAAPTRPPWLGVPWLPRRWLRPALIALAAVVVIVVAVVLALQSRAPSHTVPPALIGSQQSDLTENVGEFGWRIVTEERRADDTDVGEILSTDPEPGSSLREGGTLTVVVSLGPPLVDVPQGLEGRIQEEAEAQLTAEGTELVPEIVEEPSDDLAPGTVIRVEADKPQLPKGSTVRVVVSSGPPPIPMPDLRGDDLDDATRALEALGLQVESEVDPDADGDDGEVVRTDPAADEEVARGSTVTVIVAGDELTEVPDVVGKDLDDARDELKDADLEVGEVFGNRRGDVFVTNPPPGQEVPEGTKIDLVLV